MIKKRLTATSDEDSDNDEELRVRPAKARKKRKDSQILKILNRARSGYFNNSMNNKSNQKSIGPEHVLKFCLKDIIPLRAHEHIFMGLSSCGNFMISYKRIACEIESNYDFNSGYKYELFFWIYRPHMPFGRYVRSQNSP